MATKGNSLEIKARLALDISEVDKAIKNLNQSIKKIDIGGGFVEIYKNQIKGLSKSFGDFKKTIDKDITPTQFNVLFDKLKTDLAVAAKQGEISVEQLAKAFNSIENIRALETIAKLDQEIAAGAKVIADYNAKTKQMNEIAKQGDFENKNAQERRKIFTDMVSELEKLKSQGDQISEADKERTTYLEEQINLMKEYNNLSAERADLRKTEAESMVSSKKAEKRRAMIDLEPYTEEDYKNQAAAIQSSDLYRKEVENQLLKIGGEASSQFKQAEVRVEKFNLGVKKSKGLVDDFLKILLGGGLFMQVRNLYQDSLRFFKEIDKSLTEISMVTGMSRAQVNGLVDEFTRIAGITGSTAGQVAEMALLYYQQGKTTKEVMLLSEETAKFAKVAGISAADATNRLTAALNGYQVSAEDASTVTDKMSALAAAAATSVDEMSVAISKSASQARMAGMDMDYFYSYLATIQEVTREAPENIGTSMKTIISRFQEIKDIGKVTEDETSFNRVATALSKVGISMLDSTGQMKGLSDIMDQLGRKWNTLDKNTKVYIATVAAGSRQQSRFIALMDNYDRALQLVEISQNSAGETARQHARYMDSVEAATNKLNNTWQTFITSIASSGVITTVLQFIERGVSALGALFKIPVANFLVGLTAIGMALKSVSDKLKLFEDTKFLENTRKSFKIFKEELAKIGKTKIEIPVGVKKEKSVELQRDELGSVIMGPDGEPLTKEIEKNIDVYQELYVTKEQQIEIDKLMNNQMLTTETRGAAIQDILDKGVKTNKKFNISLTSLKDGFKSVGKAIADFGRAIAKELLIMAALTFTMAIIDDIFNGASRAIESANEKATKQSDTFRNLDQSIKDLSSSMEIYLELSKNINKSAEQQDKLNKAIERITELAPEAVIGYDAMGQAIVDYSRVQEAQTKKQEELQVEARKNIATQMSSASTVATNTKRGGEEAYISGGVATASGAIAALAAVGVANVWNPAGWTALGVAAVAALATGVTFLTYKATKWIQDQTMNAAQKQEFQRLLLAKSPEIQKSIRSLTEEYVAVGAENMQVARDELSAFINTEGYAIFAKQAAKKGWKGNKLKEETEKWTDSLVEGYGLLAQSGGLDALAKIREEMASTISGQGTALADIEKTFGTQITDALTRAGIDAGSQTGKAIIDGLYSSIYGEQANIYRIVQSIDENIAVATDEVYRNSLIRMKDFIKETDTMLASVMARAGLFNISEEGVKIFEGFDTSDIENKFSSFSTKTKEVGYTLGTLNIMYDELAKTQAELAAETDSESENYANLTTKIDILKTGINGLIDGMDTMRNISFKDISDTIKNATEGFTETINLISGIEESGYNLDMTSFQGLLNTFDKVNMLLEDSPELAAKYGDAMGQIGSSISYTNGQITTNAEAVKLLADIQREATIQTLKDKQIEIDDEISIQQTRAALIQSQIDTVTLAIDNKISQTELEGQLNAQMKKAYDDQIVNTVNKNNALVNSELATNKILEQLANAKLLIAKGQVEAGSALADEATKAYNNISSDLSSTFIANYRLDEQNQEQYKKNLDTTKKSLQNQLDVVNNTIKSLQGRKASLGSFISLLESGTDYVQNFMKTGSKSAEEYVNKLNDLYNILQKIANLEERLNDIRKERELLLPGQGVEYAQSLLDELQVNTDLYNERVRLRESQKAERDTMASTIKASEYSKYFSFDKSGKMTIDTSYMSATDDTRKAVESLAESYGALDDALITTDNLLYDNAQTIKTVMSEYVSVATEAEDLILEGVKEREKTIHEARMSALDAEINMINKAKEARQKAREDMQDEKDIAQSQEALRRAMLDTSGKMNSQVLQLTKDLEEKQQALSEKRFSNDLDSRINWLNDQKDAEQAAYDAKLANMTEYWDQVEYIMSLSLDEQINFLKTWNVNYREESALGQQLMLDDWSSTLGTYQELTDAGIDYASLKDSLGTVTSEIKNMDNEINQTIIDATTLKQKLADLGIGTTSTGTKNGSGGGSPTSNPEVLPTEQKVGSEATAPVKYGIYSPGDIIDAKSDSLTSFYNVWDPKNNTIRPVMGSGIKKGAVNDMLIKNGKKYYHFGSNAVYVEEKDTKIDKAAAPTPTALAGSVGPVGLFDPTSIYANGGIVDYTGPAWVDGSKTKPEAFLNPYQTQQIANLAKALSPNSIEGNKSIGGDVVFGNISFNIDSMSSPEDGRRALDTFVQEANKLMQQKGVGTRLTTVK